jgi:hypothetical protein
MADIGSYLLLGVVVIGGFWLLKNGPALLMQIQAGGGLGGGGGGGGLGGGGLGGGGLGDGGLGGTGGGGFGGGLGGTTDFCTQNPTDPTCQLSGSSIQLGPGTTSTSQITKDVVAIYNNNCVKTFGCPKLSSAVIRGLPINFRSSYLTASMLARNSQDYIDITQGIVKAMAMNVHGAVCAPCSRALSGGTPSPGQLGCTPPHSLSSSQYSGTCVNVCSSCGLGYQTCFLGTFNGARKAVCQNCGKGDCGSLRQQFLNTFMVPSSGGGGGGGSTGGGNGGLGTIVPGLNHGSGSAGHCTKITAGPYAGHCVGDECGPGGAGSIMSNGDCSRSNPSCACVNHMLTPPCTGIC